MWQVPVNSIKSTMILYHVEQSDHGVRSSSFRVEQGLLKIISAVLYSVQHIFRRFEDAVIVADLVHHLQEPLTAVGTGLSIDGVVRAPCGICCASGSSH